ncbi:hypothetical protein [Prosthecochloris sp. GSB1]|uniref:hypothetical protein n=1 Tax=Prosthecochloris sp. GSB1 TaxID=281093 RepID=UPI001294716B|nr:hypothetical protein [Prosthecochloris sp. GSB1]
MQKDISEKLDARVTAETAGKHCPSFPENQPRRATLERLFKELNGENLQITRPLRASVS